MSVHEMIMQKANYKWNLLSCSCMCHFDETELIIPKRICVKPGVNISPHETPTLMHMTCEVLFYSTLQSFHSTKYYITSQGLCNGVGLEVWVGGESFMPRRTHIIGAHLKIFVLWLAPCSQNFYLSILIPFTIMIFVKGGGGGGGGVEYCIMKYSPSEIISL